MERLFGAFNLAAKAMGKTTVEMNKALERGEVTAKEMLPKLIPLMDELALKNGALATQLETAQTAQNRFNIVAQEGADTIFKSGMSDGLKDLFETLQKILKNSQPELKKLGKIFQWTFKLIERAVLTITPVLQVLINNFELLFGAAMILKIQRFASAASVSFARAFFPLTAALAAIEEIASLLSDNIVGSLETTLGHQVNLRTGTTREFKRDKDGVLRDAGGEKSIIGFTPWDKQDIIAPWALFRRALPSAAEWLTGSGEQASSSKAEVKMDINVTGIPDEIMASHIGQKISEEMNAQINYVTLPQSR